GRELEPSPPLPPERGLRPRRPAADRNEARDAARHRALRPRRSQGRLKTRAARSANPPPVLLPVGVRAAFQAGFLRVVAERAEAHAEELGGLGLHAARALERLDHQLGADVLEVRLEVEALF